jgi:hypothetical protein
MAYYSPWYTPLNRKMQEAACKEAEAKSNATQEKENSEPVRKKPRTAAEDITGEAHTPKPEVQDYRVCSSAPMTPTRDIGDTQSLSHVLGEQDGLQGLPSRVASRPRARPLRMLRDPL